MPVRTPYAAPNLHIQTNMMMHSSCAQLKLRRSIQSWTPGIGVAAR